MRVIIHVFHTKRLDPTKIHNEIEFFEAPGYYLFGPSKRHLRETRFENNKKNRKIVLSLYILSSILILQSTFEPMQMYKCRLRKKITDVEYISIYFVISSNSY